MTPESPQPSSRGVSAAAKVIGLLLMLAVSIGLGLLIFKGIQTRVHAETALRNETNADSVPIVNIIHPKRGAPTSELILPGSAEPFTETPVYARTSGYLKRWHFDIGARVKAGDLLAEIEGPEVDQQLAQARAELNTARANYELAKSTAERWQQLLATDSVARQEADEKQGDLRSKRAIMDAIAANVRRLEETQAFQKVYAPFAGVITARNTDTGALINAGSSGTGKELFHIAALDRLRVFVGVPQSYTAAARPGPADVTLAEHPGRIYRGQLARTTSSIDPSSRTLRVEIDVANPDGSLLPGSYLQVHLKLPGAAQSVTVPVSATLFRSEGLRVAAIRDGKVSLIAVAVGRDYGNELEIVSGLRPEDVLVNNPPDSLLDGQLVRIAEGQGTGK